MITTLTHCDPGEDDVCRRCGEAVLAPTQVCPGTRDDDPLEVVEELSLRYRRRDWRVLLRAVERECHYLGRRAARPSAEPDGADARNLAWLREIAPQLARAAGVEPRFL